VDAPTSEVETFLSFMISINSNA